MWKKCSNLKVRQFWGLIPTFVEVTGEKNGREGFLHPLPILNRVKLTASTQQLSFSSSCFFKAANFWGDFFQNNRFFAEVTFRIATFPDRNFYQTVSLEQLFSQNSYFLVEELSMNKDIYRRATLFRSRQSYAALNYFLEKANFSEKQCSAVPRFSRAAPFSQHTF